MRRTDAGRVPAAGPARQRVRRAATMVGLLALAGTSFVAAAAPAPALAGSCSVDTPPCPIAASDTYTATVGQKLTVAAPGLLANDTGPSGTYVSTSPLDSDPFSWWGNAAISYQQNGSFTYTPDKNTPFTGDDYFTYEIVDPASNAISTGEVTIVVKPVVTNDTYTVYVNHTLTVKAPGVIANDQGVDPISVAIDPTSTRGRIVNDDLNGAFDYTPATNFKGTDSFTYQVDDLNGDHTYTGTVTINVVSPPPPPPPPPAKPKGYWMVGSTGTVYPFGQVRNYGNAPTNTVTHLEPTPSRLGYWVVDSTGNVYAYGDAKTYGSAPNLRPDEQISSLSATPTGKGYWLFSNRGRVVARGDAKFYGDVHNLTLNGPVVGSVATPTGHGYYMVASDGGIFAFGDAKFHGSMGGTHLNQPVNGLVPTTTNSGYWLVASDGGIFAFNAPFRGSMGSSPLNKPIIGMVRYGNGYLMVGSDGGIFAFSNQPFYGSLGNQTLPNPIVGVAAAG